MLKIYLNCFLFCLGTALVAFLAQMTFSLSDNETSLLAAVGSFLILVIYYNPAEREHRDNLHKGPYIRLVSKEDRDDDKYGR